MRKMFYTLSCHILSSSSSFRASSCSDLIQPTYVDIPQTVKFVKKFKETFFLKLKNLNNFEKINNPPFFLNFLSTYLIYSHNTIFLISISVFHLSPSFDFLEKTWQAFLVELPRGGLFLFLFGLLTVGILTFLFNRRRFNLS